LKFQAESRGNIREKSDQHFREVDGNTRRLEDVAHDKKVISDVSRYAPLSSTIESNREIERAIDVASGEADNKAEQVHKTIEGNIQQVLNQKIENDHRAKLSQKNAQSIDRAMESVTQAAGAKPPLDRAKQAAAGDSEYYNQESKRVTDELKKKQRHIDGIIENFSGSYPKISSKDHSSHDPFILDDFIKYNVPFLDGNSYRQQLDGVKRKERISQAKKNQEEDRMRHEQEKLLRKKPPINPSSTESPKPGYDCKPPEYKRN